MTDRTVVFLMIGYGLVAVALQQRFANDFSDLGGRLLSLKMSSRRVPHKETLLQMQSRRWWIAIVEYVHARSCFFWRNYLTAAPYVVTGLP